MKDSKKQLAFIVAISTWLVLLIYGAIQVANGTDMPSWYEFVMYPLSAVTFLGCCWMDAKGYN